MAVTDAFAAGLMSNAGMHRVQRERRAYCAHSKASWPLPPQHASECLIERVSPVWSIVKLSSSSKIDWKHLACFSVLGIHRVVCQHPISLKDEHASLTRAFGVVGVNGFRG